MAKQHGKDAVVQLAGNDLSAYTKNTAFNRKADIHDTTCYGADGHTKGAGLTDGTVTISGVYDAGTSGTPKEVIQPILGSSITYAFTYRPEGSGSGLHQSVCNVIVAEYDETVPVADFISWSASLEISGDVDDTDQ